MNAALLYLTARHSSTGSFNSRKVICNGSFVDYSKSIPTLLCKFLSFFELGKKQTKKKLLSVLLSSPALVLKVAKDSYRDGLKRGGKTNRPAAGVL